MESEPGRHEYLPQARYGIDIRRAKQANELTISIADKERFLCKCLPRVKSCQTRQKMYYIWILKD